MHPELAFRYRLAKRLLILTVGVFILMLVLAAAGGFDPEESEWLLGILTPLNTLYGSVLVKYLLKHKHVNPTVTSTEEATLPQFKSLTATFFYIHYLLLYAGILAGAFNIITPEFMKFSIATLETVFAGYMGQVVADIFKSE